MPWFASTSLGITGTTTLTCQRSQVGVLSRPSPECSNACLIAPTGRTRRDPDHRVTDLRRGVAESPSNKHKPTYKTTGPHSGPEFADLCLTTWLWRQGHATSQATWSSSTSSNRPDVRPTAVGNFVGACP